MNTPRSIVESLGSNSMERVEAAERAIQALVDKARMGSAEAARSSNVPVNEAASSGKAQERRPSSDGDAQRSIGTTSPQATPVPAPSLTSHMVSIAQDCIDEMCAPLVTVSDDELTNECIAAWECVRGLHHEYMVNQRSDEKFRAGILAVARRAISSRPAPAAEALIHAASSVDWGQVHGHGGSPCFHLEGGRFCLRALTWAGHQGETPAHLHEPLYVAMTRLAKASPAAVTPSAAFVVAADALRYVSGQTECATKRDNEHHARGVYDTARAALSAMGEGVAVSVTTPAAIPPAPDLCECGHMRAMHFDEDGDHNGPCLWRVHQDAPHCKCDMFHAARTSKPSAPPPAVSESRVTEIAARLAWMMWQSEIDVLVDRVAELDEIVTNATAAGFARRAELSDRVDALAELGRGDQGNEDTARKRLEHEMEERVHAFDDMEGRGPCGGSRCFLSHTRDGIWIHSSKSYGTCSERAPVSRAESPEPGEAGPTPDECMVAYMRAAYTDQPEKYHTYAQACVEELRGVAAVRALCLGRRSVVKVNMHEHANGVEVREVLSDGTDRLVVIVPMDYFATRSATAGEKEAK